MRCSIAMFTLFICALMAKAETIPYTWKNVAIYGGGYVTGLVVHPAEPDLLYIRTDVGGCYRWDAKASRWIPLTDAFPPSQSNWYGGESIAIDPSDPNVVYMAAGKYSGGKPPGTIFKSTDRGSTWTKLPVDLKMAGNGKFRSGGERLFVDRGDPKVILFGSRTEGLWRSDDAGTSWAAVEAFPKESVDEAGIQCITGNAGNLYAGVWGGGVHQSTDHGATWKKLVGSPAKPQRMDVSPDGTLYAASSDGVWAMGKDLAWRNITPPDQTKGFGAVTVNPHDAKHVVVGIAGSSAIPGMESRGIYESRDGGATWIDKHQAVEGTPSWIPRRYVAMSIASIAFDPHHNGRIWLTDFHTVWRGADVTQQPIAWTINGDGIENIVAFSFCSAPAPGPNLVSCMADVSGFLHDNGLDQPPSAMLGKWGSSSWDQYNYQITYSPTNPQILARASGGRWNNVWGGGYSTDGGKTWRKYPTFPEKTIPMRIAMSATDSNTLVVATLKGSPIRTGDGGRTWQVIDAVPPSITADWNWSQPLVADPVAGDVFYYAAGSKLYRSKNGGKHFAVVNEKLPWEPNWGQLLPIPGQSGKLMLAGYNQGLLQSEDGGKSWKKLGGIARARLAAFGRGLSDNDPPALYLFGLFDKSHPLAAEEETVFRSLDLGRTWQSITDPKQPIGDIPNCMTGSMQNFGQLFIGTNGRGIYYGEPSK